MIESQFYVSPMLMDGNLYENWLFFWKRFENYLLAVEANKKDEATQCAQLLQMIGEEGFRIYTTLKFQEDEKNKIKILLDKYEEYLILNNTYKIIICYMYHLPTELFNWEFSLFWFTGFWVLVRIITE